MINNLEQGFFGIGIQNGKTPENLGFYGVQRKIWEQVLFLP